MAMPSLMGVDTVLLGKLGLLECQPALPASGDFCLSATKSSPVQRPRSPCRALELGVLPTRERLQCCTLLAYRITEGIMEGTLNAEISGALQSAFVLLPGQSLRNEAVAGCPEPALVLFSYLAALP